MFIKKNTYKNGYINSSKNEHDNNLIILFIIILIFVLGLILYKIYNYDKTPIDKTPINNTPNLQVAIRNPLDNLKAEYFFRFNEILLEIKTEGIKDIRRQPYNPNDTENITDYGEYYETRINYIKSFLYNTDIDNLMYNLIINDKYNTITPNYDSYKPVIDHYGKNELTDTQKDIITSALSKNLTIVQGPPGTGKTATSSELILNYLKYFPHNKILICSRSNTAVNDIASKLINLANNDPITLKKISRIFSRTEFEKLSNDTNDKHKHLLDYNKKYDINNSNIILTTCGSLDNMKFNNVKFDMILIDECGQTTEPETIIAISKASSKLKLVLVGDHNQLAPFIGVNTPIANKLKTSLFERLIETKKIKPVFTLDVQFRMHSSISDFTYNHFYKTGTNPVIVKNAPGLDARFENKDNKLLDENGKILNKNFKATNNFWEQVHAQSNIYLTNKYPNDKSIKDITVEQKNNRILYINTHSEENIEGNTNDGQANIVKDVIDILIKIYQINQDEIGVITPYAKQKDLIKTKLSKYSDIVVKSVDDFQGNEKKYIIYSTIKSKDSTDKKINEFVLEPARLNVAITRAQFGLIIIGNYKYFYDNTNEAWKSMLKHYKNNDAIIPYKETDIDPLSLLDPTKPTFKNIKFI